MREEAAQICAMCASGRTFAVYTSDAAEWLGLPIDVDAHRIAFNLVVRIQNDRLRDSGSGPGWKREDCAEAEALLRTGWEP